MTNSNGGLFRTAAGLRGNPEWLVPGAQECTERTVRA
jgi:hypothetical protein